MAGALAGYETVQRLELLAAVFAGVTAFLAALVGLVRPLARPERMAGASGCCQRVDAWE